jgi:hypothetical protein
MENTNENENDLTLNQGDVEWNKEIESNIKIIGEKAKGYKIMHIQESRRIGKLYSWLMYICIILGPLSGILSGISTFNLTEPDNNDNDNNDNNNNDTQQIINIPTIHLADPYVLPIVSSCIAFLSGIVIAVTKYGKFEERSAIHKSTAFKYASLESNIRLELSIPRKNRGKPVEYSIWVGKKFDELFSTSPLVSSKIYKNYVKTAIKNNCPFPDEYKITVNMDEKIEETLNSPNIIVKTDNEDLTKEIDLSKNETLNLFRDDGIMEYELQRINRF